MVGWERCTRSSMSPAQRQRACRLLVGLLGRVVLRLRGCGGVWDRLWHGACGPETWVRWSWGLGIAFKSTVVNMRDKRLAAQFAGGCEEPSSFARRTAEGGCPHIGI